LHGHISVWSGFLPGKRKTGLDRECGQELWLRWPSGELSALIPMHRNYFIDRSYWEEVKIERGASGKPTALVYDRFKGLALSPQ